MRIIADENMSFPEEAFAQFGDVELYPGRAITSRVLADADILLVRSVTKVTKELLEATKIKFVGTATIGTDHIDKEYLKTAGIKFSSAAGCNSYAVAEYVLTAVARYLESGQKEIAGTKLGIVGHGNIGTKVEAWAKALGFEVVINDPPKARLNKGAHYSSLEDALGCDIITFHVPLTKQGRDKTLHLLNESNIELIKPGALLINSSRGPVVDNLALIRRLKTKSDLFTVFDVWEGEPNINRELLGLVNYGTPHIAGYSLEGKVNGTKILYSALCKAFGEKAKWEPSLPNVDNENIILDDVKTEAVISKITSHVYDIRRDFNQLLKVQKLDEAERGKYFDGLRKNYPLRRELNNYSVYLRTENERIKNILKTLRLRLETK